MAFRFALAPLLRLRQSMERQRSLQLQAVSLRVSQARQTLVQIERFVADSAQSDCAGLSAGRTAAELQFGAVLRENMQRFREELQRNLRDLELAHQKALSEYHQAYREREVLVTLRTSQRKVYQQEQLRREQRELDAVHLLQRWRRRN